MLLAPTLTVLFILGLAVGSFLNVLAMRAGRGEAPTGRSHCDACATTLSWRELIPIASFMCQKGRCLHCGTVLSVQYLLTELGTGMAFAFIGGSVLSEALVRGDIMSLFLICFYYAAISAMIVVMIADFNYQIIPNGAVLSLLIQGIFAAVLRNGLICMPGISCALFSLSGLEADAAAAILSVGFLFALWYISKGSAMGFGDVKLIGATALLLGFPLSAVALVFAFWLGGIAGLVLLAVGLRGLKSRIAFGPFIIAGVALAFLFGHAFLAASGFAYLI